MREFNIEEESHKLKEQKRKSRRQYYSAKKSRLDRFSSTLLGLYRKGHPITDLHRFLRNNRCKVHYSTVWKWVQKNG